MNRLTSEQLTSRHYTIPRYDTVWNPLYDFVRIDRLCEQHTFFINPIGGIGMEPKTERDTNMYLPGQLPKGQQFLVEGIRVVFWPDCDVHRGRFREDIQDIKRVLLAGSLRFVIQNRIYSAGAPLACYPACFPVFAEITPNFFKRALRKLSLLRVHKHAYHSIVPVFIQSEQFFTVTLHFDPKQRLKLNAPGKLGVILDGKIIREAC